MPVNKSIFVDRSTQNRPIPFNHNPIPYNLIPAQMVIKAELNHHFIKLNLAAAYV